MGTGVGGSGNGNSRAKSEWERELQRDLWLGMRGNGNDSMRIGGMGTARVIPAHIPTWSPIPVHTCNECSSVCNRHGTRSLSHWVNESFGSSFPSGSPGHRVIILTRCETRVFFRFSKKCPKCKTYIWNAEMTKVIVSQVSVVGLKSLDVSPCNELILLPMIIKNSLHTPTHKSTFGVHYRTGSPGQLGNNK